MVTLTCKQCGHVNEGERIYCHNCGVKLDRSILPQAEGKSPASIQAEHRRVKRVVNPSRGFFTGAVRSLFNTLLWAVVVAAIIEMVQPPDNRPKMYSHEESMGAQPIQLMIEELMQRPGGQRLVLSEETINQYLAHTISSKPSSLGLVDIKFVRSFVNCDKGRIRISTEQSLFDYSFFATSFYQLAIQNNHLEATNVGGALGRLPVHPKIMAFSDVIFQKLWDALTRERKQLDGLAAIEIQDKSVILTKLGK